MRFGPLSLKKPVNSTPINNVVGVTGFIVNLDDHLKTFEINDLTVSYSSYTGVLPEGFAEGFWVEVEGTLDIVGGEMTATSIEPGDEIDKANADQIEVFGFVTVCNFGFAVHHRQPGGGT